MKIHPIDYDLLYAQANVRFDKAGVVGSIVDKILDNASQYQTVARGSGVPWWCVAAIHHMEADLNFNCHLHNGDPLTARTVHVPRGRPLAPPASGHFPYTWEESAADALTDEWKPPTWGIAGCLAFLERYNGLGYLARGMNTPYLWSFTNLYTKGLYVADGVFDPNAVSTQAGAATILKTLQQRGAMSLKP